MLFVFVFVYVSSRNMYLYNAYIYTYFLLQSVIFFQVMLPDGRFVAAAPLADTVFINVADLLQRWSGDRLPSAVCTQLYYFSKIKTVALLKRESYSVFKR